MNILMLIHRLWDNSPYAFYVHDQAKALAALGHTVTVIAPVGTGPMMKTMRPAAAKIERETPRTANIEGIAVYYPRYLTAGNAGERLWGGWMMARAALPIARRLHKEAAFDVVHAHMLPREGHAGEIIGKALNIPCVITLHGTDVLSSFVPGQMPAARNKRIAQRADALVAVSALLARRVQPYCDKAIHIVHNGVDVALVKSEAVRIPRSILSVGTLKKRKCIVETLEAFIRLAADYPDAQLRIIGLGELEDALRARAKEAGVERRVHLLGGCTHGQVMEEMAQSDVMCLPSYGEGYGVVYIEAMASGAVAIGACGEGIDGTIVDGENGLLVPAGDVNAIEGALRRIFDSPEEMQALRARAKHTVQTLTWENNARQMEAIYSAAKTKKAGGASDEEERH